MCFFLLFFLVLFIVSSHNETVKHSPRNSTMKNPLEKRFQNLSQNQNKSHTRQKLKQWPKEKKNQKTSKIQKTIGTKEKGYFKKLKSIPVWGLRRINFSRWDVKWRLEKIKNGVWKQTANDNTTNNIKFYEYIRNKTAAKGSVNRPDKQCTEEIFKRIRRLQGN